MKTILTTQTVTIPPGVEVKVKARNVTVPSLSLLSLSQPSRILPPKRLSSMSEDSSVVCIILIRR
jgi:hypothetical protein